MTGNAYLDNYSMSWIMLSDLKPIDSDHPKRTTVAWNTMLGPFFLINQQNLKRTILTRCVYKESLMKTPTVISCSCSTDLLTFNPISVLSMAVSRLWTSKAFWFPSRLIPASFLLSWWRSSWTWEIINHTYLLNTCKYHATQNIS